MAQMIIVAIASIGLIVFVSFIAARLVRARTAGMSIRMQIFLALALIVGAFAFGLGLMVLDRVKARADLVGEEAARGEARAIAGLIAAEMEVSGASFEQVARRLEGAPTPDVAYASRRGEDEPAELHLALLDDQGTVVLERGRSPDEPGTVAVTVPVMSGGKLVGHARVVKPTLLIQQTLADFAPTVLIISLLLGAVAAGAAALIGRTIARPIEELTRFAERVSEGDRRAPPPLGHGREVMRLRQALDSMRRELQGRPFVETFAADLSHELKNPVAAIRASAEVLQDGALDEPEEATRFVARIAESSTRIEALLNDLLSLARLEARGVEQAAPVDMVERARAAVQTAVDDGAEVELEALGPAMVRGDGTWLTRAIGNLVDNARIHGRGGPVHVDVRRRDDEVVCTVTNRGQVARGVKPRIFRRFVTTRADRGGTGLGLAIVRAIAEAHGGRAECTNIGPPEVTFTIMLPHARRGLGG
ncbi:MAG TPA: HAMP domain-containing protein [Polyangiaceae bacterium]|nr:HAMP domain-containing protein [Polyangiaceae bacterium]